MITLLSRLFIKNRENTSSPSVRKAYGILSGVVGIILNVFLFGIKIFAGTVSGSIAITADAFNNLSDAGSSVITLLGFSLAGQKPDSRHPFGHGRIEYLSGLLVSVIIILMSFELGKSSVQKIIAPKAADFSWLTFAILAASVAVKLYMFVYNRMLSRKISSAAMKATASDSLTDSVATVVVMTSTLISRFTGLNIDGWCGLAVALFILYTGISAARDTLTPLLGQKPDKELVDRITSVVMAAPEICGMHDLIVHDYGPGRLMISLHAEVPADGDILALHDVIDNVERELRDEFGCSATIHMDPVVADDSVMHAKESVINAVHSVHPSLTIHDFRMVKGPSHTNYIFDVVVPYETKLDAEQVRCDIENAVRKLPGNCFAVVEIDSEFV